MERYFNITGACNPQEHYMVNLDSRLAEIKKMVDAGKYFVINRGRQYGKTTTLKALEKYLMQDYIVVRMDFQRVSSSEFQQEGTFVKAFARILWSVRNIRSYMSEDIQSEIKTMKYSKEFVLDDLFSVLSDWCDEAEKPIILIIDEVDNASNNQVFLDFLAQLRGYYLERNDRPTFQSVILAGVHDIRNLRQKIRPDTEHKHNSPWNIASPFDIDMSFSVDDISGMLTEYENDNHTGMDISEISQLIYDYTSGYPVLVSTLCKYMDENFGWTRDCFIQAEKKLLMEKTPLFESLVNKLEDDEKLRKLIYTILFKGEKLPFSLYDASFNSAIMYGFLKNQNGSVAVANRVFETILCDWFLSQEYTESEMFRAAGNDKNQFIENNQLNMERILEKFIQHFDDIYGNQPDKFKEDDGRKLFLLYLRPIINGTGNYYIEAQTRDMKRIDVIVDYLGKQYIIELKIWHGDEYNARGENQLAEYLDYYHIDKGYLLSFNFNKNKKSGMHTIELNGRTIVEAVV
jgi:hypothetical protein